MNRQCDIGEQALKAVVNSEPSHRRFFESFHLASRHIKPARRAAMRIRSTDLLGNKGHRAPRRAWEAVIGREMRRKWVVVGEYGA